MLQMPLDIQLDDSARLENFYRGENFQLLNRFKELTTATSEFYYIWGAEGVGKSHLTQAVCRAVSEQGKTAVYFPLNNQQLQPAILEGLEFADLICLDSVEAIAGQPDWEEAIFDLFNRLKSCERNLVMSSQLPLSSLSVNLADLKSRISSMEIYRLQPINSEKQADFIIEAGYHRGLEISFEVASFLLSRTERDMKKLTEIIQLLDRQSLTHQRKITIPFVKAILEL